MSQLEPGWYSDPAGLFTYRYWDGSRWTSHVSSNGDTATDPSPLPPEVAEVPPAPGTMAPMAGPPAQQQSQPTVEVRQGSGTLAGVVVGVLIVAIVVVLFVVLSGDGDDTESPTTLAPATTEAVDPTTTVP